MDKKSNMKQAMYEMFGVGSDASYAAAEQALPLSPLIFEEEAIAPAAKSSAPAASFFASGTVMQGTLQTVGNVEIAGSFKGDIVSDGMVILRAGVQGNIAAGSLTLAGCKLTGDAAVKTAVYITTDSELLGNVTAKELQCSGRITGNLKIADNVALAQTARVSGDIDTDTISVAKGALLCGRVNIGKGNE